MIEQLLFYLLMLSPAEAVPFHAQGEMTGEVTSHTAILQTRLTAAPTRGEADGEVPGAIGWARFELSRFEDFSETRFTTWKEALAENDYIIKHLVDGLPADATIFYRVQIGLAAGQPERVGPVRSFRTAPRPDTTRDVSFAVVTSHKYSAVDHPDGFESYAAMLNLAPSFIVPTGDNVYYDSDWPRGSDVESCRHMWHRTYSLPRLVRFYSRVPAYWEKDDHDYRFDDADPFMPNRKYPNAGPGKESIGHELGLALFLEQVPVPEKTYRTVRWGSALQIWLTEGRDFRSPNAMPDGPGKTMWGVEQRQWLQESILRSKAMFKVLVSPSPLLGPDRANKKDNQCNRNGFFTEGQNFLTFLRENEVDNFFITCGDRHWKYHSVHKASGYEEFCSGSLGDGSAVKNPDYSDPAVDRKWFLGNGGFLIVRVVAERVRTPSIVFDFYEKDGNLVHSVSRDLR
jgi:alkaline phosphatase/alkaline phosphatase D